MVVSWPDKLQHTLILFRQTSCRQRSVGGTRLPGGDEKRQLRSRRLNQHVLPYRDPAPTASAALDRVHEKQHYTSQPVFHYHRQGTRASYHPLSARRLDDDSQPFLCCSRNDRPSSNSHSIQDCPQMQHGRRTTESHLLKTDLVL